MAGRKLAEMDLPADDREPDCFCVKEAVMPFGRFPGADSVLGPEMKSTGEVMGVAERLPGARTRSPSSPSTTRCPPAARRSSRCATATSARSCRSRKHLHAARLPDHVDARAPRARCARRASRSTEVLKKHEGRPNIVDAITNGEVQLVINTPFGRETRSDGYHIRTAAIRHGITNITTLPAAQAIVQAIEAVKEDRLGVYALQDFEAVDGRR